MNACILAQAASTSTKELLFGFSSDDIVKIANAGCAGVSVLGIAVIGTVVLASSNIPTTKADVMKSFMKTCIWLAAICGGSSVLLAWQNANKVAVAESKAAAAQTETLEVKQQVAKAQSDLERSLQQVAVLKQFEGGRAPASEPPPNLKLHLDTINRAAATLKHIGDSKAPASPP